MLQARFYPIVDENIVTCGTKNAKYYDISDLKLIRTGDTEVFINGSILFLKKISSPWQVWIHKMYEVLIYQTT